MIRFDRVSVRYADAATEALTDVDLSIPEGELCLVIGPTGSGKSTLLGAINGHVPHFTGGTLTGRVTVAGRDTARARPRDLADVVGVVPQEPAAAFVTDCVEDELAYGMECLGLPAPVMRRRVEESLDLLGLAALRDRPLRTLSGGERQRVAIAAVLAAHPQVLVLDEPTSALDPGGAEEVLAALQRLVSDLGLTVVLAEHRLERVAQFADRVVLLRVGAPPIVGDPATVLLDSPIAPPVVELARLAGWSPAPLSIRAARRLAGPLRDQLSRLSAPTPSSSQSPMMGSPATPIALAELSGLVAGYAGAPVLSGVDLRITAGTVTALMGRNGVGKSTLLHCLVGLHATTRGTVRVGGADPTGLRGQDLLSRVGFVPQDPGRLLWADSVADECTDADADAGLPSGTTAAVLARLAADIDPQTHPRDLSEGGRLLLALAIVLAPQPPLVLLDEPTRGLDYATKRRLVAILREAAATGRGVLLSTHDVELVAELADRVVLLADGELVADGPATDVIVGSPAFAPQVAKVLAPLPWLTVGDVADALAAP
jgi:energy-coupling factor transport system ATP-binding protein